MLKRFLAPSAVLLACTAIPVHAHPQHGAMLERADANQDGMIVRDEFLAARAELFAKMDRNADGVLDDADRTEAEEARKYRRMKGMHGRADADGDGKISKEEFVQSGTPMFDRLDANNDSVLDEKEIAAAREKGAKWREKRAAEAPSSP